MKFVLCFLLLFSFLLDETLAQEKPGLLVTPTRVVLEGKYRSASVVLVNNGNVKGNYKISLVNRRMMEDGSIVKVEDGEKELEGERFAGSMLRISPRRVTLGPGERQKVRILARKPKNLEDGEYRSHLNFVVLPDEFLSEREKQKQEKEADDGSLTISIKANFGVTIPIIVRNGDISASASINNMQYRRDDDGSDYVNFIINREGDKSLYGDVEIIYYSSNGKEYVLKSLGGLAVYTPNKKRSFNIKLDVPEGVNLADGVIEVIYKLKEKEGGTILANSKLNL